MPGPGLVLGTQGLQLSHMEALAREGAVGIQMWSHRTPMSRLTDVNTGNRVVPRERLHFFFGLFCLGITTPPQVKAAI